MRNFSLSARNEVATAHDVCLGQRVPETCNDNSSCRPSPVMNDCVPDSQPDSSRRRYSRCGSGLRLFGARPADTAGQGVSCVIEEQHQGKEKEERLVDGEID